VRKMFGQKLGVDWESFIFIQKGAGKTRTLRDLEEIRTNTVVKGIKSFEREAQKWPHAHCIIGAGHSGLRQALSFLKEGITNFVVYDRHAEVGGAAWVEQANNSSKLQTEFGVYHLQYDPDYPVPTNYKTQPSARELREHFLEISEEYGIMPYVHLNRNVATMEVATDRNDPSGFSQTYQLIIEQTKSGPNPGEETMIECSTMAAFPGGLINPKRATFKGEDVFEGQLGYGMYNEFDYTRVAQERVVILGFGAFATENIRTCVEHHVGHLTMICRRKNLTMPRPVSWMVNQSLWPVPGKMWLDMAKKFYDLGADAGLGDPWTYYAVMTTEKRINATLRQDSRFGIGDVIYLACAYGKCKILTDQVKRMKNNGIQLETGPTVECEHIIKVFGFLGDCTTDKLFATKKMEGWHVNGDFRRFIWSENPGIDAGKFGGTSFSPGAISTAELVSWIIRYPVDAFMIVGTGVLPTKKFDASSARPCYVWDPRSAGQIGMMYGGIPGYAEKTANHGFFNRQRQLEMHPLEVHLDECIADWHKYCAIFEEGGATQERPPYPFTAEYLREMVALQDKEAQDEQDKQMARMQG